MESHAGHLRGKVIRRLVCSNLQRGGVLCLIHTFEIGKEKEREVGGGRAGKGRLFKGTPESTAAPKKRREVMEKVQSTGGRRDDRETPRRNAMP